MGGGRLLRVRGRVFEEGWGKVGKEENGRRKGVVKKG